MSDWDSAMAIELVYSMWIRRRDAHSFNRSNVGGLPVFFDHGAAFHAERESRSIEGFFRSGDNPGCAGLWRMEQISADDCGTEIQRQNQRARFAKNSVDRHVYQPIRNPDQFHSALDRARDYIKTVSAADIKTALIKAGYHFPARLLLTRLLLTNQRRLDQELLKLKSILAPPTTGSGRHL
jgi:hypothetical protein